MAFQPVTDCAKVAIEGRLNDEPAIITLAFRGLPGFGAAAIQQLAIDVADVFVTSGLVWLPEDYVYEQTVATGLRDPIDVTFTSDTASGQTGQIVSTAAPNNVTLCVSFRTGFTGRTSRGRNYWPGIPNSVITDNKVTAAFANGVAGFYETALLPPGGISDWVWVVVSRRIDNAPRTFGVSTAITQVVIVDTVVDSQRRRLPGRGD